MLGITRETSDSDAGALACVTQHSAVDTFKLVPAGDVHTTMYSMTFCACLSNYKCNLVVEVVHGSHPEQKTLFIVTLVFEPYTTIS